MLQFFLSTQLRHGWKCQQSQEHCHAHVLPTSTRRMAIANGTCVSFCNQPKAQFGYLKRVMPVYRCLHTFFGWRHLATSRESKAHLASPGYAPGTIAVNVTLMERRFNACQTHSSMYPSIFNHFPVILPVSLTVRHFSTFLRILGQSR